MMMADEMTTCESRRLFMSLWLLLAEANGKNGISV
jgi:hypothetical protein